MKAQLEQRVEGLQKSLQEKSKIIEKQRLDFEDLVQQNLLQKQMRQ